MGKYRQQRESFRDVVLIEHHLKKKESYITLDVEMEDYYRIKSESKTLESEPHNRIGFE